MQQLFRQIATLALTSLLIGSPSFGAQNPGTAPGSTTPGSTPPSTTPSTTAPLPPNTTGQTPPTTPAPSKPAPPAADKNAPPTDTPVQQKDTVDPKNSKDDVEAIGNRNVSGKINFYSLEKEIALGKSLAQEVERSSKLIDDPVVTEYVNRVGQNLVRNSDAKVPFTIKVIDSDEVNAFALPGGFFYVNSGLILRAQEEAELAGVMAHEISHEIGRAHV